MANYLGDHTARLQGRLTLNPISHIDPVGSVFLPALLVFTHSPILIGYAKPVPYNPYNLPGKYDETLVAFAGPGTNIVLALIFGLLDASLLDAFKVIVFINMLLALFNLIPIPPLDGSKIISGILPRPFSRTYDTFRFALERLGVLTGTLLILIVFFMLAPFFSVALQALFYLLTGVPL
jgi:Zn-dependent protease